MTTTSLAPTEKSDQLSRRGISEPQWITLTKSLYPGANPNSVLLVWDYCVARRLDPLKKPCHIVPMEVKDAKSGAYGWRDVVMPGIYEHRTTAQRTGVYLGHSEPVYGPDVEYMGVTAPAWCAMTMYRWNKEAGVRAEFPVKVLFAEVVAVSKDKKTGEFKANSRWSKAPTQMLTKCTEAAGLREAFPDEIGGEQTYEEMEGQRHVEAVIDAEPVKPAPEGYDDWLTDLQAVCDTGLEALEKAWAASKEEFRAHLTSTEPQAFDALKARAVTPL